MTKAEVVLRIDPILRLAARGDLAAVKQVLRRQPALLNAMSDGHHRTLLWEAANANRIELAKFLVTMGANLDIPGRYRSETFVLLTPYAIARARGRREMAEFLLSEGAAVDLYSAAYLGDQPLVEAEIRARPSAASARHPEDSVWDVTPLHYAVAGQQREMVRFVVSMGAEVAAHSELLFDIACRLGRMDLIETLDEAGADPAQAEAFSVVYRGSMEIMEFFFTRGANVSQPGRATGWPPIAYVSRGDKGEHPERVRALISYGADVNAAGPRGVTALHAAAKAGFASVIEVLVEAGADASVKTARGDTPLDLAIRHKRPAAAAMLRSVAN